MTDELREFLNNSVQFIEEEDFDSLYEHASYYGGKLLPELTEFLVDCGGTPWNDIKKLYVGMFNGNTNITSMTIDDGSNLPQNIFYNCSGVESITIKNCASTIPARCFSRCVNLKEVSGVAPTMINVDAFIHCSSLTSFDFSNTRFVGDAAFYGAGLTSIELTNDCVVRSLAFGNCSNLESARLDCYRILEDAFRGCTSLKNVVIENMAVAIGSKVFEDCTNLTSVTFNGTKEDFKNANIMYDWRGNAPISTIHCLDGDVKYRVKA